MGADRNYRGSTILNLLVRLLAWPVSLVLLVVVGRLSVVSVV